MSWMRDKEPARVKADALAMAGRKRREGCEACVTAYVDLARRHGATDEEVRHALQDGQPKVDAHAR